MSDATVYAGAGNDVIFTMDGNDLIYAGDGGVKAIYDRGAGTDIVDVWLGYFEVKLTMVNNDLYITSRYSSYSPIEDPNAVILMDHSFSDGQSVEYLRLSGGWLVELSSLWSMQAPTETSDPWAMSMAGHPMLQAPEGLLVSIASAYGAGTVAAAVASNLEAIPDHLQHLVGGATTMTSFEIFSRGGPKDDLVGIAPLAETTANAYAEIISFDRGLLHDLSALVTYV